MGIGDGQKRSIFSNSVSLEKSNDDQAKLPPPILHQYMDY